MVDNNNSSCKHSGSTILLTNQHTYVYTHKCRLTDLKSGLIVLPLLIIEHILTCNRNSFLKFTSWRKCRLGLCDFKQSTQIEMTTCNPLSHSNETFPTNLGLSNHMAISWTLKSTTATSFTIRNNWESLPGDSPLLPFLMNINSEKMAGKIGGKVWVSCNESRRK